MTGARAGLLIVGAGQAGAQLAFSAREEGWDRPITLVGAEEHPPYARPFLSKGFLTAGEEPSDHYLRAPGFYDEQGITLLTGERVEAITFTGGGAGRARTRSGRPLRFERLALATGSRPRALPVEGARSRGVHTLRDASDAGALKAALATDAEVVVIGAGFIGLEVAAAVAAAGRPVTVVESAPRVLSRAVSSATGEALAGLHRAAGVHLLTGRTVQRVDADGRGRVRSVELDGGQRIPADVVLVGVGAVPDDGLARAAGLRCEGGVVVDSRSLASDGYTLAVGDCASLPDPSPGPGPAPRIRLESVDNAVEQARAAAVTLVGGDRPYRGVPWFWSDQGRTKVQIAGLALPGDDAVLRRGTAPDRFTVLRFRGDRFVAAECVNAPADFLTARRALVAGASPAREAAADTGVRLKDVLAAGAEAPAG
ncbi:NAD(P)/FAD-dependent oxidoreductase [Nocardiopsis changdeensis]|uniref:NAD(P)/FAD-dependent oxidoreductase n=1 Tax=Nocardiopsis changdeensis TaxID=2831969 RepID=UPI003F45815D